MGGGLFLPVCRMATLQLQMSVEGQDGVVNLLKIAQHSEERVFQAATDLVKIHLSVDWEALVDNYGVLALDITSCKGWKMGSDAFYQFGD
jgi:hypothetical protein